MARLTSEQRKNLPKDMFGLPDDRSYPMPDAAHVYSAIRFFGDCPPEKRKTLANNINKFAKLYKVTVNLPPSSKFKIYADKSILKESANTISDQVISKEVSTIIIKEASMNDTKFSPNNNPDPRVATSINIAIRNAAKSYLDKEYYLNGTEDRTEIGDYVYDTDLKICYDITREFVYGKTLEDPAVLSKLQLLHNKQMVTNAFNNVHNYLRKSPVVGNILNDITNAIDKVPETSLMDNMDKKMKSLGANYDKALFTFDKDMYVGAIPESDCCNFTDTERSAVTSSNIIGRLIDSCRGVLTNSCGYPPMPEDHIHKMKFAVKSMATRKIIDGYFINENHSFVKMGRCIYGLVHECKVPGQGSCVINALKLYDMDKPYYLNEVAKEYEKRDGVLPKMPIRRISFKSKNLNSSNEVFTEGLHISKAGDISLSFDISKSMMDKYSACHKILKTDEKNKNYDGMKHAIAYLFAMVCTIEDKYVGKDKTIDVNSDEYKDAIKARAFAINDIKRYMKIVQKHERGFNFMKFYTDNGYDKNIYTVRATTLAGLKNLFRIIMA